MRAKKVIANGRSRIIVINEVSGIDKTREAVLLAMGADKWEYKKKDKYGNPINISL